MSAFDREKLARIQRDVVRAIDERDPELFASLYENDGALLPADGSTVSGRAAIAEFFAAWLADGFRTQTLRNVRLTAGDTVAVEQGLAIAGYEDGSEVHSNYIVVHVRQDDGSWLMQRDIWTRVGAA